MYKLQKQLLISLTASALALPGISRANITSVDEAISKTNDQTNTSQINHPLQNEALSAELASRPRNPVQHLYMDLLYTNHSTHFLASDTHSITDGFYGYVENPINGKQDFKVTFSKDIVTSATPVFYTPVGDSAFQVTTRATVKDTRSAINIQTTRYENKFSLSLNGGFSTEEDYDSRFFGVNAAVDLNQSNTTLLLGTGFAKNDSHPISTDFEREGGTAIEQDFLIGLTQVLTQKAVLKQNLYYRKQQGYLSDPYKLTFIPPFPRSDSRPETRHSFAYLAQLAYYLGDPALHLNYRYYKDSWHIFSHTIEAALKIPIINGWKLTPELRYYTQKAARFYGLYFTTVPLDGRFSSDYRLANFGQLGGRIQLEKEFAKTFRFYTAYEHMRRKKDLQLTHANETQPGEKKFTRLSMSAFLIGLQKLFN